jgi:glycine betaine/proline transport system ATP-binding protein
LGSSCEYIIQTKNVSKLYGINRIEAAKMMKEGCDKAEVYKKNGVTVALWDVNLNIRRGEIFVIIGLSGSGKSTMVRCFNRLLRPTSGQIIFDGDDIASMKKDEILKLRREKISMVFQSFGLMSHRDVIGNVAYGLEVRGASREQREAKAQEVIDMVGLSGWEHQPCDSLSGGMRQRVGIARALASDPEVLLMDEPFSALDPLVRRDMQFELLSIQRKLEKTVIFVTHDIDEAFKLGDTVAIMRDGKVVQIDTPERMSSDPADDYVRKFIDSADKSKVLSVKNIMITPSCLVKTGDSLDYAISEMRKNAVSSAFVVDDRLLLKGILSIGTAIRMHRENKTIADGMQTGIVTTSPGTMVADIMGIAAEAHYPIAVVDDENRLTGIVTKASVLSSLV